MRHGELQLQRNDYKKALSAFTKAHIINHGIDSYRALVTCECHLKNFESAEIFANDCFHEFSSTKEGKSYSI